MSISYSSKGKLTIIAPGDTKLTHNRGEEYNLFLQVLSIINDASRSISVIGACEPDFLHRRFSSGGLYALMKEQSELTSFPDFAIVRDDIVLCFDHFEIDASEHIIKNGNDKGSKLMFFAGSNNHPET